MRSEPNKDAIDCSYSTIAWSPSVMTNRPIRPVKGTRDFYPEVMAHRTWLYQKIRQVSELFGYQEYEGPILESLELYAAKSGEELVKEQAFVFPDRGGNLITLRPELTPTLARMVADRQRQLLFPLRWWSFGPMWRYERPQRGRSREFFQWNIDLIGVDTPEADAELVAIAATFFRAVGLEPKDVGIYVNNRRLMERELGALGIAPDQRKDVFRLIDRRERMRPDSWRAYAQDLGLTVEQLTGLEKLLNNGELWQESEELTRLFSALDAMGMSDYVTYGPEIIRGLDYYTGTVFESYDRARKYRAILAGGRYDNLVADVGGEPLPGVGYAMGDMVISLILEQHGLLPEFDGRSPAPVFVAAFDAERLRDALALAAELRNAGLNTISYPESAKLGKQLRYADRIGARLALILGPDELQRDEVAIKDLRSGEQRVVPRQKLVTTLLQLLAPDSAS